MALVGAQIANQVIAEENARLSKRNIQAVEINVLDDGDGNLELGLLALRNAVIEEVLASTGDAINGPPRFIHLARGVVLALDALLLAIDHAQGTRGHRSAEANVNGMLNAVELHQHAAMVDGHTRITTSNCSAQHRSNLEPKGGKQHLEALVELEAIAATTTHDDLLVQSLLGQSRDNAAYMNVVRLKRHGLLMAESQRVKRLLADNNVALVTNALQISGNLRFVEHENLPRGFIYGRPGDTCDRPVDTCGHHASTCSHAVGTCDRPVARPHLNALYTIEHNQIDQPSLVQLYKHFTSPAPISTIWPANSTQCLI